MIEAIIANLGWIILAAVVISIISLGFRVVRPTQKGIIERLGKYKRVAAQGFQVIIPLVDKMYKINLTERMMDVEPQEIITEDNLNAKVDLVVYYKVRSDDESVKKSMYNVDDFESQIIKLAQTTARNVIGTMSFKTVNSERSNLNTQLAKVLDEESNSWGVEIVRVEMMEITPPEDVQDTMNKVLKAENEKRSAIDFATAAETEADGERRSEIKKAMGRKQSLILEADGKAEAIKKVAVADAERIVKIAAAEAERIEKVNTSIQKHFVGQAEIYKKLETVQNSLENNTKFVIDPNTEITNVIAESMAGITPIKTKKVKTVKTIKTNARM